MGNDRRKLELLCALLLSLPGAPIIYYGDELGMGDNIYLGDRNGVRTPMQWNANRNAGFSNAGPQQLYLPVVVDYEYHYETVNVETQQNNPNSLLSWMKRLIALRHRSLALGQGGLELLYPSNPKVLAFIRRAGDERVLVVANLSRFAQYTELDLSPLEGQTPVELFGHVEFPRVGKSPYLLTLGPHGFFWFSLGPAAALQAAGDGCAVREANQEPSLATLEVHGTWDDVFSGVACRRLEAILPAFLRSRRWFAGKPRTIRSCEVWDVLPIRSPALKTSVGMVLLRVEYTEGESDGYLIPVGFGDEERLRTSDAPGPAEIICRLEVEKGGAHSTGVLYDAFGDEGLSRFLMEMAVSRRRFQGKRGVLAGRPARALRRMRREPERPLKIVVSKAEQSNSTVFYGEQFLLKLYRRLEEGVNPELEIESFLTDTLAFPHAPPLVGAIEYVSRRRTPVTIGVLEGFVHNEGRRLEVHAGGGRSLLREHSRAAAVCRTAVAPCSPRAASATRGAGAPGHGGVDVRALPAIGGPVGAEDGGVAHRPVVGDRPAPLRPGTLLAVVPAFALPGRPHPRGPHVHRAPPQHGPGLRRGPGPG